MTFGTRLKEARKRSGLTQQDVASKIGIDFTTVSKYENDRSEPDNDTLIKMADLYGVEIDALLGREYQVINLGEDVIRESEYELEYLEWVKENIDDEFFYHFHEMKEEEKRQHMQDLYFLYEREQFKKSKK